MESGIRVAPSHWNTIFNKRVCAIRKTHRFTGSGSGSSSPLSPHTFPNAAAMTKTKP